jgi:predicted alpha/beta-hydrolase family hydrolase
VTPRAAEALTLDVPGAGPVSAMLQRPAGAHALLVLAHGAGAGMRHPFMEAVSAGLARCGVATLRFQFPYMEAGRRRPDPAPVAARAVRAAVAAARRRARGVPVFAGGKSFGGRMTSTAAAEGLEGAAGLVLLGFPLHPADRVDRARARHLFDVRLPMLFVQGSRDRMADLPAMAAVVGELGSGASLHVVEQGDHGFAVPRRSGRDPRGVLEEVCNVVAQWVRLRRV